MIRQLLKVLARLENKQQLGTSMIPWGLFGSGIKAGLEIYKNKKAADVAMSEAKLLHIEKMKRGEIEFSGKIADNQKNDWKDEFVLLTISSPLFLLAYSVFAEDEKMQEKIDLYFQKLQEMPWWIVDLQGAELKALQSLGSLLETVQIIHTELEMNPMYEGQCLFGDVHKFLLDNGFDLEYGDTNVRFGSNFIFTNQR